MAFNIAQFKTNGLVYGGARPSLFEVIFSIPQNIGLAPISADKARFVCRAAELPESTVSSIDIPYFGRKIKVAGERTFADWSTTIMNDEDFAVRSMFEAWSNALNRMVANVRDPGTAGELYKADFEIVQFGVDGVPIRSYLLVGAFPTNISGIGVDWNSGNNIEEFTVNFAYDYWVPLLEVSDRVAGGVNPYADRALLDNSPA